MSMYTVCILPRTDTEEVSVFPLVEMVTFVFWMNGTLTVWPPAAAASAVGLVGGQQSSCSVMVVLLMSSLAVVVDDWALVACGDDVVEDRRTAGLKRFWSTLDVLAGSGGFLMFESGRDAIVDILFA